MIKQRKKMTKTAKTAKPKSKALTALQIENKRLLAALAEEKQAAVDERVHSERLETAIGIHDYIARNIAVTAKLTDELNRVRASAQELCDEFFVRGDWTTKTRKEAAIRLQSVITETAQPGASREHFDIASIRVWCALATNGKERTSFYVHKDQVDEVRGYLVASKRDWVISDCDMSEALQKRGVLKVEIKEVEKQDDIEQLRVELKEANYWRERWCMNDKLHAEQSQKNWLEAKDLKAEVKRLRDECNRYHEENECFLARANERGAEVERLTRALADEHELVMLGGRKYRELKAENERLRVQHNLMTSRGDGFKQLYEEREAQLATLCDAVERAVGLHVNVTRCALSGEPEEDVAPEMCVVLLEARDAALANTPTPVKPCTDRTGMLGIYTVRLWNKVIQAESDYYCPMVRGIGVDVFAHEQVVHSTEWTGMFGWDGELLRVDYLCGIPWDDVCSVHADLAHEQANSPAKKEERTCP